jgi:hypothetical protein
MAAGLGFKTFTTGEVLSAANVNGYLMQGVLVFASAAARTAAVTSPQEGQFSFLKDTNATEYYDGTNWVASSGASAFAGCLLFNSADYSIANNTTTVLTWNSETYDTNTFHSTSTNTSRITIPSGKAGYYLITCMVFFENGSAANALRMRVLKNGTSIYSNQETQQFQKGSVLSVPVNLAVGDYVEIQAFQNSGATGTIYAGTTENAHFSASFLGA